MNDKEYQAYIITNIIIDDNDCWLWQGAIGSDKGYGRSRRIGNSQWAHRNSFTVFKRPLKLFEVICHTCDNPPCVNPDHLEAGTHQDNNIKSLALGRRVMPTNLADPKIGFDGIRNLRQESSRLSLQELATKYGISERQVGRIITGESWRDK